jgi:hypothetical protein
MGRVEALAAALVPANTIAINAYGSHSTTDGGIVSAQFNVSVVNAT